MEITSVEIYPITKGDDLRAYANITFDNCFRVTGVRLLLRPIGYVLIMPVRKKQDGKIEQTFHPLTPEMHDRIDAAVIAEYERVTGEKNVSHLYIGEQTTVETRHDIEQRMDELARQYKDTHDRKIIDKIKSLGRRLGQMMMLG